MLEGVVSTYLALVARVMGPSGDDPDPIKRYTKLFLTKAHKLDIFLCPSSLKQKGTLCRQPNYLTLLNLPEDVRCFGHLRFLWELGGMGEGFIPRIKKFIREMGPQFALLVSKSIMVEQSYSDLTKNLFQDTSIQEQLYDTDTIISNQKIPHSDISWPRLVGMPETNRDRMERPQ